MNSESPTGWFQSHAVSMLECGIAPATAWPNTSVEKDQKTMKEFEKEIHAAMKRLKQLFHENKEAHEIYGIGHFWEPTTDLSILGRLLLYTTEDSLRSLIDAIPKEEQYIHRENLKNIRIDSNNRLKQKRKTK